MYNAWLTFFLWLFLRLATIHLRQIAQAYHGAFSLKFPERIDSGTFSVCANSCEVDGHSSSRPPTRSRTASGSVMMPILLSACFAFQYLERCSDRQKLHCLLTTCRALSSFLDSRGPIRTHALVRCEPHSDFGLRSNRPGKN